ncbi:hypothetical protein C806_01810 [Lachnospiraceae bacterium 3-1]|nr:hypothetical protein C806_01810 [Lachnospiraceae bacterium 3-1]
MEKQKGMERELDLMELFWNILFSWRQIICFGVIFAVLFMEIKYFKDWRTYQTSQNISIEQNMMAGLTNEEKNQISNVREIIKRLEEYQEYLDTSVLMQIDPYEKHVIELQYYVKSDYMFNYTQDTQNDYTSDVVTMYYNYIISGEMSQSVIKTLQLPISQEDISELWAIGMIGNSVSIKIAYPEEKKLEEIAEFVKSTLKKKESELQKIGSHELQLLGESKNVVVDTGLVDRKHTISNNIVYLNVQLNALKANMSEQQLELLNDKLQDDIKGSTTSVVRPSLSKKYFLLGAFVGIFLIIIWIVCKMLFTAKLQNSEEVPVLYNVRLLGEISIPSQKRKFLSSIDKKLLAIKNRKKKKLTMEQQIKVLSANIVLSCKKQGIDCVYITGSEYESIDIEVWDMLKKELSAQNLQIEEGGNIFYDAESLKQGTAIGNFLFVEQRGKSIYDEISNELNLAREYKNYILGVVVLV